MLTNIDLEKNEPPDGNKQRCKRDYHPASEEP